MLVLPLIEPAEQSSPVILTEIYGNLFVECAEVGNFNISVQHLHC
jgi:hypothetical protein